MKLIKCPWLLNHSTFLQILLLRLFFAISKPEFTRAFLVATYSVTPNAKDSVLWHWTVYRVVKRHDFAATKLLEKTKGLAAKTDINNLQPLWNDNGSKQATQCDASKTAACTKHTNWERYPPYTLLWQMDKQSQRVFRRASVKTVCTSKQRKMAGARCNRVYYSLGGDVTPVLHCLASTLLCCDSLSTGSG